MACDFNCIIETEELVKVTDNDNHADGDAVQDRDVVGPTTP